MAIIHHTRSSSHHLASRLIKSSPPDRTMVSTHTMSTTFSLYSKISIGCLTMHHYSSHHMSMMLTETCIILENDIQNTQGTINLLSSTQKFTHIVRRISDTTPTSRTIHDMHSNIIEMINLRNK